MSSSAGVFVAPARPVTRSAVCQLAGPGAGPGHGRRHRHRRSGQRGRSAATVRERRPLHGGEGSREEEYDSGDDMHQFQAAQEENFAFMLGLMSQVPSQSQAQPGAEAEEEFEWRGLDMTAMYALPTRMVRSDAAPKGETCGGRCGLDLHAVKNTWLMTLPCGHEMHHDCAIPWFKAHDTCPIAGCSVSDFTPAPAASAPREFESAGGDRFANVERVLVTLLLENEPFLRPRGNLTRGDANVTIVTAFSNDGMSLRFDRNHQPNPIVWLGISRAEVRDIIIARAGPLFCITLRIFLCDPDASEELDEDEYNPRSPFKRIYMVNVLDSRIYKCDLIESIEANTHDSATQALMAPETRVIYM